MSRNVTALSALLALVAFGGCRARMPDAYGVYADTNHGRLELRGEVIQRVGNMMSFFPGVPGPSGLECTSLKDLIVFEKDVDPGSVELVKLDYLKEGSLTGFVGFGSVNTPVRLWVADKNRIEVNVKPAEDHRDMYLIVPRTQLPNGFYALSIGRFGGDGMTEARAYDVVVGSTADYPSYATAVGAMKTEAEKQAPSLLDKMNAMANQRDYRDLSSVYRPSGRTLSDAEVQEFAAGNRTWLESTGKILKSEVVSVEPLDENHARCSVRTTYERIGVENEDVVIGKIGSNDYITEMK